jgi:type IV secretory pathway TraG/TraD family ATPase VirD4
MQGALGILSFFPTHYTLAGLATFIFQADFRENLQKEIATQTLSEAQSQLLLSYQTSLSLFEQMPERTQGDIKATVATVLSPCTHPHIASSFSATTNQALPLADVIKGQVFCLDMPQSAYGQATRIIATAIKLRWFQVMASRRRHLNWNQTRPVFFLCDEYQSLVTADPNGQTLSDLTFWDKARDTNTLGIVAAQSVSSLYAAIGDRAATETLLANFRQKLCFKTEDPETLRYLQSIIGQVSAPKSQRSQQRSTTRQSHGVSQSHSQSESQAEQMQSVIDSQLMRLLKRHQVIALLLLGLEARDDLLSVQPLEILTQ